MHPYQTKLNNTCHNSFCALVAVNYGCNNTLYHINLLVQGFDSVHMVYQTIHHRFCPQSKLRFVTNAAFVFFLL